MIGCSCCMLNPFDLTVSYSQRKKWIWCCHKLGNTEVRILLTSSRSLKSNPRYQVILARLTRRVLPNGGEPRERWYLMSIPPILLKWGQRDQVPPAGHNHWCVAASRGFPYIAIGALRYPEGALQGTSKCRPGPLFLVTVAVPSVHLTLHP